MKRFFHDRLQRRKQPLFVRPIGKIVHGLSLKQLR